MTICYLQLKASTCQLRYGKRFSYPVLDIVLIKGLKIIVIYKYNNIKNYVDDGYAVGRWLWIYKFKALGSKIGILNQYNIIKLPSNRFH